MNKELNINGKHQSEESPQKQRFSPGSSQDSISLYRAQIDQLSQASANFEKYLQRKIIKERLEAADETTSLLNIYNDREKQHEKQLVYMQEALTRQMEVDKVITQKLILSHQEYITLQHTFSCREKEFGEKLFATLKAAENEKAELLRLHVEQEKTLHQQLSDTLAQNQHQYEQFRTSATEFGEHLKQQLQAEQQACIHLKQELTSLNVEIDKMRFSVSWRITAPFRKLLDLFSPRNSRSISDPLENKGRYCEQCTVDPSDQKNESSEKQIMLERKPMSNIARHEKAAIARNLDDLLSAYDESFVRSAYMILLGRAPDPEGMRYYLLRLRRGVSKMEIIAQIRYSAEGKIRNADVVGLQEALNQYRWAKLPFIGPLLRMAGYASREPDIQQRLRIIENQLAIVSDKTDYLNEIDKQMSVLDEDNKKRFNKIHLEINKLHSLFCKYISNKNIDQPIAYEYESDVIADTYNNVSSILSNPIVFDSEQPDEVIKELSMHVRRSSEAVQMTR